MTILYHTAKFNSNNGVKNVVLGQTAKFNDRQYFWLYGILHWPIGKEKHSIREQSVDGVVHKLDTCEGQLIFPYLSLIMDLKKKGWLGIKQDIYECVQLCVEVLTRKLIYIY